MVPIEGFRSFWTKQVDGVWTTTCTGCNTSWKAGTEDVCPVCDADHKHRQFTLEGGKAVCHCGEVMRDDQSGEFQTLVGFGRGKCGEYHDDNCRKRRYSCSNGHTATISILRTCPKCEWTGKRTCFCHPGEKVEQWPE